MSTENNSTHSADSRQLSIFGSDAHDARPLPEIIASGGSGWSEFELQYHDVDGKRYYAVQDWIAGVAQPVGHPGDYWKDLLMRATKAGIEFRASCAKLKYRATDGKFYKMDFATDRGLYAITQRMDTNTGIRNKVLAYLVDAGVALDEMRRDPGLAIDAGVAGYKRQGKSDAWIAQRNKNIEANKAVRQTFQDTHVTATPQYATLFGAENKIALRRSKSEIIKALNLTEAQAHQFRDYLGVFALRALEAADLTATTRMEMLGRKLSDAEQYEIVIHSARIAAPAFWAMAEYAGVDLVTGARLLTSGGR